MELDSSILSSCLFHTSNLFARRMEKLAEHVFKDKEIAPSYLYLLILVKESPGTTQKELCNKLGIAPSTSTRFIDKLVKKDIVIRQTEWKETHIYLTKYGEELMQQMDDQFKELYYLYSSILGEEKSLQLAKDLYEASEILKKENL